jgi:hypothetical protein
LLRRKLGLSYQFFFLFGGSEMMSSRIAIVGCALVVTCATAIVAAQSYLDGSAKARGDYGQSTVSRALSGARDSINEFRTYAKSASTIDPEVAKETSDAIGDYITKAQKHMVWMRKQAETGKDTETLASLDLIDKNLAEAANAHGVMHDLCKKNNVDAASSLLCCEQIDASLAKAIDEHDKLMQRLGLPTATTAKK